MRSTRARRGLSLIEVVVAIVLVAALSAVVMPAMMQRVRSARAEANIAELETLRTAILMFYNDVGRVPKTVEYLYKIPAVSPVDVCNNAIPALNQGRFRGPYVARHIQSVGPPSNAYPLATNDSIDVNLTHLTVNNQTAIRIRMIGPERDIAEAMDLKVDGASDANAGVITYTTGGLLGQSYVVFYFIPIRNQGCP